LNYQKLFLETKVSEKKKKNQTRRKKRKWIKMSYKCSFRDFDYGDLKKYSSGLVVDVYSKSCGPCRNSAPAVDLLAEKYSSVKFVGLDSKQESKIADEWDIESLPTFVVFKNGRMVEKVDSSFLKKKKFKSYAEGLEYVIKKTF
jgi:thioredoxin 1